MVTDLGFRKNLGLKSIKFAFVPPTSIGKPRLSAKMIQHFLTVPSLFDGHLGQKNGLFPVFFQNDSVTAHYDFLGVFDPFERCQN
jgi:hypothetical protein